MPRDLCYVEGKATRHQSISYDTLGGRRLFSKLAERPHTWKRRPEKKSVVRGTEWGIYMERKGEREGDLQILNLPLYVCICMYIHLLILYHCVLFYSQFAPPIPQLHYYAMYLLSPKGVGRDLKILGEPLVIPYITNIHMIYIYMYIQVLYNTRYNSIQYL